MKFKQVFAIFLLAHVYALPVSAADEADVVLVPNFRDSWPTVTLEDLPENGVRFCESPGTEAILRFQANSTSNDEWRRDAEGSATEETASNPNTTSGIQFQAARVKGPLPSRFFDEDRAVVLTGVMAVCEYQGHLKLTSGRLTFVVPTQGDTVQLVEDIPSREPDFAYSLVHSYAPHTRLPSFGFHDQELGFLRLDAQLSNRMLPLPDSGLTATFDMRFRLGFRVVDHRSGGEK